MLLSADYEYAKLARAGIARLIPSELMTAGHALVGAFNQHVLWTPPGSGVRVLDAGRLGVTAQRARSHASGFLTGREVIATMVEADAWTRDGEAFVDVDLTT